MTLRLDGVSYVHTSAGAGRRATRHTTTSATTTPGIHDLTMEAPSGKVTVIVGPNGAGKTTALRVAAGVLRPDQGQVTVNSQRLTDLSARERALRLGFVPQGNHVDHAFTVHDVVTMGRYARTGRWRNPDVEDLEQIDRAIEAMALTALRDRTVTSLSGGERRRTLLARVHAQSPDVILLDEPTANLDLGQRWRTERWMRSLADEGRTVVAVLHDLASAARIADDMVLLEHGRATARGDPADVLTDEHLERAYGVPVHVHRDGDRWSFSPA